MALFSLDNAVTMSSNGDKRWNRLAESQMTDFELGKQALEVLLSWTQENDLAQTRNEATTRLHLIDRLLLEVLQWPNHAVTAETYQDGVYSDYELGTPAKMFLVEAKREGNYFELPAGWKNSTASLATVTQVSPETGAAVRQAMGYCQRRGIPYGSVCNGTQFIAFIATRLDGVPPIEGRALVFSSLEDIIGRFAEFWDALSPVGILQNRLLSILNADVLQAPPPKLAARVLGYPGYKNRNPVATELQILGELFLEDVIRHHDLEVEFLEQAYCKSGALSQYSLVAKEILAARYSTTFQQETQVTAEAVTSKKGLSPALSQDMFAASVSRRPILLVGDVGAGKSIFIKNLIKVQAREELRTALVLYIDFGSRPALVDDLRPYVRAEIERQMLEDHKVDLRERNFVRGVYHGALQRF